MPFMLPSEQARLRECMTYRSLLDELLLLVEDNAREPWFQNNARAFLAVCDMFAETARQHHDILVDKFISAPSAGLDASHLKGITASGPPLPVLLRSLRILRDYRCAVAEGESATRHADLERLRRAVA
jgi:hypothetical protein